MIVVADTSVVILLARLGLLWILRRLFGSVRIPERVREELNVKTDTSDYAGIQEAFDNGWLLVEPDPGVSSEESKGEDAAIDLALRLGAVFVVLDDLAARKRARARGLHVTGTVGLLRRAIDAGLVQGGDELTARVIESGFRASDELLAELNP